MGQGDGSSKLESKGVDMRYGITAIDLLQVGFILLKVTGRIDWSWIWVLSPMWITAVIVLVAYIIIKIKGR